MKKRFLSMILSLLLALSAASPAFAEEAALYIIDQKNVVGNALAQLNQQAEEIKDTYGMVVSWAIVDSTGGTGTAAYAEQVYQACYGDADGILLIFSEEDAEWYLYQSGKADDLFSSADEDALWAAYNDCQYYDDGVEAYLNTAQEMLEAKADGSSSEAAETVESAEPSEETKPVQEPAEEETQSALPSEWPKPLLVDEADLLDDAEETQLLNALEEISERQSCDVAVVTIGSLDGKTAEEYADDYFDDNGYGFGSDKDGLLLLVSMEDRDWWISTHGFGITAFTDAGIDYLSEQFRPSLSDGDYSAAFATYAELCDDFLTKARDGEPYDVDNLPEKPKSFTDILFILAFSLLWGFLPVYVVALRKKSKLRSVRSKIAARDYEVPGSAVLTAQADHLVNTYVTTRIIQRDDSNHGGSSTHTSSSGETHGGGGGKF